MNEDDINRLFDPKITEILAMLEDSPKPISVISDQLNLDVNEIKTRLEPLIKDGFISFDESANDVIVSADIDKLTKFFEKNMNFDSTIDGLTEMDSFLN
ncbi:MAG: hypothetical protein R1F52_04605 [Candidatus Nitrosoabyssus spongiisocia]|nr:MAG: hypothetical protein R1F52_04605 [Nitrosopumilaceae archaeon AB1(1)]